MVVIPVGDRRFSAHIRLAILGCTGTVRRPCAVILLALLLGQAVVAQDIKYPPQNMMIPGPASTLESAAWLAELKQWRKESLIRIGYDGSQYERPEFAWTQRAFIQPQMMIHDRYFYDPTTRQYTVDRYLDDLERRYGGIDAVLIWPSYPNLGVDNRNQYDLVRDLPGGIPALRRVVADFHKRGVRVLFPLMLWDQGTRDETVPDWVTATQLMADIGADGINGDTIRDFPRVFRAASDSTSHPIVFETQTANAKPAEALAWDNLSWNDWILLTDIPGWRYPLVPQVDADKWLEPRHMVNTTDRWAHDRTDALQHAFSMVLVTRVGKTSSESGIKSLNVTRVRCAE